MGVGVENTIPLGGMAIGRYLINKKDWYASNPPDHHCPEDVRLIDDPTFTFGDVERAPHVEVRQRDFLSRLRLVADWSSRAEEMALLEWLEAKYGASSCAKYGPPTRTGSSR
jgi:hypothetical protein